MQFKKDEQHSDDVKNFTKVLDVQTWETTCERLFTEAIKFSGLSHDYCIEVFSQKIDELIGQFPSEQQEKALLIAKNWDYATEIERQQIQKRNTEYGSCIHGIDRDCCSLGCGDIPLP